MTDFERLFVTSLVEVALQGRTDAYGNPQRSPLDEALSAWWERNRREVIEQVVKQLDVETLAEKIAAHLERVITSPAGTFSYDREKASIDALVRAKVAERIAARVPLPGDSGHGADAGPDALSSDDDARAR